MNEIEKTARTARAVKTIEDVLEVYGALIEYIARKYLRREHLVEEAVQEVLLAAHLQRKQIFEMAETEQKRYIAKMTRNISIRIYHVEEKHEGISLNDEDIQREIADDEYVMEILGNSKIGPNLDQYIEKLSLADQDLLVRRYSDEQKYEEIAADLGITQETVRQRMSRAKRRLAKLMIEDGLFVYEERGEKNGSEK